MKEEKENKNIYDPNNCSNDKNLEFNKNSLRDDLKANYGKKYKIVKNLHIGNLDQLAIKNNDNLRSNEKKNNLIKDAKKKEQIGESASSTRISLKKKENNKNQMETIRNNNINKPRKIYVDLNDLNLENVEKNNEKNEIIDQRKIYCDNSIKTCQYTILTFFPLALLNQFKTAFNWFFLVYIIIAVNPYLSDLSVASEVTPFIIVLAISLIKEAIEDYRKYVNDKKSNNTPTLVFKKKRFYKEKCQNIKVGNIIKIYKDELIPADVLIIKSSLKNGLCYMQTSNLDGENALKPREAFNLTQKNLRNKAESVYNLFDYKNGNFYIEVLPPNKDIYDIEGTVFHNKNMNHITIKNILLRGARLKNVDYAYGIVIYTGHDTKLMQNIGHSSLKLSTIDKKLSYIILIIFIICILINIVSSTLGIAKRESLMPDYESNIINAEYVFYFRDKKTKRNYLEILKIIANNFLIYNTFIPISIIISNAVSKVFQTIYLQQYSPEYREEKDDKIKCFSTGLLDELGFVKYIFSDKTGTLTKNEMVFKGCSILTNLFDESSNSNNDSVTFDTYRSFLGIQNPPFNLSATSKKNGSFNESTRICTNLSKLSTSKVSESFPSNNIFKFLQNTSGSRSSTQIGGIPFKSTKEAAEHFFINIIINHDVLIEKDSNKEISFQGASPDEITLVSAAYEFGFCFISRENGIITVDIMDQNNNNMTEKKYKILQKFDFTSERQCSSIIVQDLSTKLILLYIKGSDKKIFSSLENYSKNNILPKTRAHVDQFAKQGLRTLCYGFKFLDSRYYKEWEKKYKETKYQSLTNKELLYEVDDLIRKIESNVILLGVSAVEDKLQNEVEKDIKKFIEAGINFWMITGDKMDTAESIGYSCGIFSEDCEVFKIRETTDVSKVIKNMQEISDKINKIDEELKNITKNHHEMIKKKKIEKEEKDKKYRMRYNSFNIEIEDDEKRSVKDTKERRSVNNYHKIFKIDNNNNNINIMANNKENNLEKAEAEKNNDYIKIRKIKIDSKTQMLNINDNIKIKEEEEDDRNNFSPFNSLKKEEDNRNIVGSIVKPNYEESANSENVSKNIFKFVAKNVDNESKYGNISIINDDVKKIKQSINSSDIFEDNDYNKELNSSNELNQRDLEQNENKNEVNKANKKTNEKEKQQKDIPLEEKAFNDYFDICQAELNQCAVRKSKGVKLFKIKYLYPRPQDNEKTYKEIKSKFSLMLEGSAINTCMNNETAAALFWGLIQRSRSLICCRASPSQKSQIVEFIKKKTDSITLAIGDGGNDVNMIRTSHIGIGIFGKEGYQAAYNSDYAISQFKYLKRLLFNQGRLSLSKNCYFLYHYFFKNFIFTIVLFWYGIYSCFSGGNYYDDYYTMCFNSFATVIPLVAYAILEEDFDPNFSSFNDKEKKILKNILPDIYKEYRDSIPFNIIKFMAIFIIGILFSYICYIIPIYSYNHNIYGNNNYGFQFCKWDSSFATYMSIVFIHYVIMATDTHYYSFGIIIFYLLQFGVLVLFLFFYDKTNDESEIYGSLSIILSNYLTWLTILITCSYCLFPYYILRRGEFYFGGFIADKIKQRNYKDIFIEKFYEKKVEQMTRVVRNVAKFKRFYYHPNEVLNEENLADQKIRKYVDDFKIKKKSSFIKKNKSYIK